MLTKDLLKYTRRQGKVIPSFLAEDHQDLIPAATTMIAVLENSRNKTRGAVEQQLDDLVRGSSSQFVARGFKKLLLDRCEFSQPRDRSWPEFRRELLTRAAALHRRCAFDDPGTFRNVILSGETEQLYADLPEFETLTKFKHLFPKQLIQRYNTAQVQGLLFDTGSLTLKTADDKAANLRRMFKFLRFFRLLASVNRLKNNALQIVIDGPLSILESSRKYGLQLASFFPALCLLDKWELDAQVTVKGKVQTLKLNQDSGYVSHYRHLSAYVPEEVRMFASHFKKTAEGWTINPNSPFLNMGEAEIVFPDFTFEDESGKQIYLELFHRWHRGSLLPRLRYCIAKGDQPLILGIDTSLMNGELKELLNSGLFPKHRYFTFRDYPSVNKVTKCLKGFS